MSITAIIIDYYLQQVESGATKEDAATNAHHIMYNRYRERMTRDDYTATYEIISRLSQI